ncbi:unnamed protein product [Notodromas monacha]|uniref:glutathione peroxidase n=1 Tax=Notodromas monacha TaxID=399045 RepID=A0A7R9BZG0_9CRUS|nr:unnamed protein product [Notodromas monacha]CAG0924172.1 unnamed protein product [Notodromas monacha]
MAGRVRIVFEEGGAVNRFVCNSKMNSIHEFTADLLSGDAVKLDNYAGKAVLIVNTASTTTRDFTQLNELVERFPRDKFAVLGFPSNQFGKQENTRNEEILNSLKYVRPGNGYEPNFDMFAKIEVNGANCHPLFDFLRRSLPTPSDDSYSLMSNPQFIVWSPVSRTDISWNFEKFLVDHEGRPIKRYSKEFESKDIADDIEELINKI